jgi:hypothetical protein
MADVYKIIASFFRQNEKIFANFIRKLYKIIANGDHGD